jgi:two-component system nitrogen regulation sensor histidine kinase NtrY
VARRVAHEIKNALTPITFAVSRLKKSADHLPEDQRERYLASLSSVHEEAEGLKRLAASFSELARLPVPELVPLDLRELVQSTLDPFENEDRSFEHSLPETAVTVEGDRSLLRQALTNVIKNAVEATGKDGAIRVELAEENAFARVTVEDSGEGWPDPDPERSLDPYVTTKETGTGLGLSLVQRTVLQHGGRLELENRSGGGARVTLFLPYRSSRKVLADEDEDTHSQR